MKQTAQTASNQRTNKINKSLMHFRHILMCVNLLGLSSTAQYSTAQYSTVQYNSKRKQVSPPKLRF